MVGALFRWRLDLFSRTTMQMDAMEDAALCHARRLHRWDRHLTGSCHLADPSSGNSTIRRRRPRRLLCRRASATVLKVTLGQCFSRLLSVLPPRVCVHGPAILPRRNCGSFSAIPSVAMSFRVETLSLFVTRAHCPSHF